jgi:hypothetical protein
MTTSVCSGLALEMCGRAPACSACRLPLNEGPLPCDRQALEKQKFVALIFQLELNRREQARARSRSFQMVLGSSQPFLANIRQTDDAHALISENFVLFFAII